ncbi:MULTISPECIES: xylulokinase [Rodentibacter]|uniref:xylulokinase n=1 Tax=Rodentibacter TaxID=1960084 RepID=UPI001CFE7373|nr:FGGY-family carbohydrate kinase [Rodentibacter sp. JRC1]GJI56818.1 ATPase [Rodentibacter sp. JRC1]
MPSNKELIRNGNISIGIEFGSTRIKTVLIDSFGNILASGGVNWENQLIDGIWTYSQENIRQGLQNAYQSLAQAVKEKYGLPIVSAQAIGISGMMHGYIPFDNQKNQLVSFRTWRNNFTTESSQKLTALFQHNIPQRWSIAHLYHAILKQEPHIAQIDYLTTLSGYVHWMLSGEKVIGIGEASGMFPIDQQTQSYDRSMLSAFNSLIAEKNYPWKITEILPKVLTAGQFAGYLTKTGARLLDPSGQLQPGIKMCPPEGDAGTGMIATNSIKETTGNISAGTSAFAMIVLKKPLSNVYEQLDIVTTPNGKPVAMAHANNCTTDINAWINIFRECLDVFGIKQSDNLLYEKLLQHSLNGDDNCGGLLSYGFYSGEHSVGLETGCPLFIHPTEGRFNLANLIRAHLYSAFGAMKSGVDILMKQENVEVTQILAHGGIFKTPNVASKILASALDVPIAIMDTASEGGAWGIALLANYLSYASTQSLEQYLDETIFKNTKFSISKPEPLMKQGYEQFMQRYIQGIPIAKAVAEFASNK